MTLAACFIDDWESSFRHARGVGVAGDDAVVVFAHDLECEAVFSVDADDGIEAGLLFTDAGFRARGDDDLDAIELAIERFDA